MWVANFVENGAVAKDIISEFDRLWNSERACDYADFIEDYRIRYKIKKEQQKLARESEVISGSNLAKTFHKIMKDKDYIKRMPKDKVEKACRLNSLRV